MTEISPRELHRFLVYLNRRRFQFMAERLSEHGLVGPMYTFLLCLEKNSGISQDFLTGYFSIDKGTVARLCKKLEGLYYIRRATCPEDKRAYRLELTDQGRAILKIIHEHLNEWSGMLLTGFGEDDRQLALRLLKRMADNVTPDKKG